MGKLLTGRYGEEPQAESVPLTLRDCSQKLGLKPSDFVSEGSPEFFRKSFGAAGRYLLFYLEKSETEGSPVWRAGYYLLPLEAADVLAALDKTRQTIGGPDSAPVLPVRLEAKQSPPPGIQGRLDAWVARSQPLFFKCGCDHLELRLDPPWGLRRRWKVRLRCPRRCQPALTNLL